MKKRNISEGFLKSIGKGFAALILCCFFCSNAFCVEMSAAEAQAAREKIVELSKSLLGKPYKYGAAGPDSFDCTGFIQYVALNSANVKLPKTTKAMYNYVSVISDEKREAGDLLFFKTITGGAINHIGIYIGGGQFISSISEDGCVKVSSVNSEYWKEKYVSSGQFLPSGRGAGEDSVSDGKTDSKETKENQKKTNALKKTADSSEEKTEKKTEDKTVQKKERLAGNVIYNKPNNVVTKPSDNIIIDTSFFLDWSLLSPHQFVLQFRGLDTMLHVKYAGWNLEPGVGIGVAWDYGLKNTQMPVILSITLNEYIRTYAGPVFTFTQTSMMDTGKSLKGSVLPGMAGISFLTPTVDLGMGFKFQGVQDVSYTVYNNVDGSALSFMESVSAGIKMHTGVKFVFPVSVFIPAKAE